MIPDQWVRQAGGQERIYLHVVAAFARTRVARTQANTVTVVYSNLLLLLRQNQLPRPGDSQPVDLAAVTDQDFLISAEQICGADDTHCGCRISCL